MDYKKKIEALEKFPEDKMQVALEFVLNEVLPE